MKIESTTLINRPIEEVFVVVTNLENNIQWDSGFLEVKRISQGPIGVGTTWKAVRKGLGQRIDTEVEITEYEPNRKCTQKGKSPFPVQVQWLFNSAEGGTRVNGRIEADPGGFFKLAEPLVASMGKRQIEADLSTLKDLMEAHAL
jgi:carbon monoxide dehydrogenase subunit G